MIPSLLAAVRVLILLRGRRLGNRGLMRRLLMPAETDGGMLAPLTTEWRRVHAQWPVHCNVNSRVRCGRGIACCVALREDRGPLLAATVQYPGKSAYY